MSYSDSPSRTDLATPWFAERVAEQERAREGTTLRAWAELVLQQLPSGPVVLLSMSIEGCALSAVVTALRDERTTWEQLAVGRVQPARTGALVLVEPIRLAPGLIEMLEQVVPDAAIIEGLAAPPSLAAA